MLTNRRLNAILRICGAGGTTLSHLAPKVGALTKVKHIGCGMNLMLHLATMLGLVLYIQLIMKAAV